MWYGRGSKAEATAVYDGTRLTVGAQAKGPAIIEFPDTTVVVPHDCLATVDPTGSVVINLNPRV
jgi:N-methylhydantoinase A